jgi:hypothetical protein
VYPEAIVKFAFLASVISIFVSVNHGLQSFGWILARNGNLSVFGITLLYPYTQA